MIAVVIINYSSAVDSQGSNCLSFCMEGSRASSGAVGSAKEVYPSRAPVLQVID